MEEEILGYIDWETGEKQQHKLHFSNPSESKSKLICPFDGTPMLHQYDEYNNDIVCINCGESYHASGGLAQEELDKKFGYRVESWKKKLEDIEEEKKSLEAKLKHVQEIGSLSNK